MDGRVLSGRPIGIGRNEKVPNGYHSYFYAGSLGNIRYYNRALTACDVMTLYNFEHDNSLDADFDGVADICDNCPLFSNPSQADSDGIGNVCDPATNVCVAIDALIASVEASGFSN